MAKKDINIVTSLVGAGLEREYLLLRQLLMAEGHYVVGMHYTNYANMNPTPADINIFLEVVCPPVLNLSRNNWLVPNSEWWNAANDRYLPQFNRILCKTKDCYNIWCDKVGASKCVYTSFESQDLYRPEIKKELRFLHVAGKSEHKNTIPVVECWNKAVCGISRCPLPQLTVLTRHPHLQQLCRQYEGNNIVCHDARVPDEEMIKMMNDHLYHIMPSEYEGFGHVIHEGLGCGALMITTDAPPMNDYEGIIPANVRVQNTSRRNLAQMRQVSAETVRDAISKALELQGRADELSANARAAFLRNREYFRNTFMGLINA